MSFPSVWTIRSAPIWIVRASYLRSTGIAKSAVAKQSAQRCNLFCRSWKRLALRTLLCPRLRFLSLWRKVRDRLAETRQRRRTLATRNAIENLANGLVDFRSRHLGGNYASISSLARLYAVGPLADRASTESTVRPHHRP